MSKIKGAIVVNTDRCKGCQLCIVACPQDVIALAQKKVNVHGYPYVEPANAWDVHRVPSSVRTGASRFIVKKWRNRIWQKSK